MVLIDGTDRRAGRGAGLLVTDFLAVLNGRKGEGRGFIPGRQMENPRFCTWTSGSAPELTVRFLGSSHL